MNVCRKISGLLSLTAILLAAASCGFFEARDNTQKLSQIRIGMTHKQVKEIMGEPPAGVFQKKNVLFYYTDPKWYDGWVTRDECTPFVFDEDEDRLIGFGYEYYNEHCAFPTKVIDQKFEFQQGQRETIIRRMDELNQRR